jgi:nitrate reductase NapE component
MASKKQPKSKSAGRKNGRAVQVAQPKPWGLILTFVAVGVVALALVGTAGFVVWDRSRPPSNVTNFYGSHETLNSLQRAIADGDVAAEDLDHPWVVEQTHVDGVEGWDGTPPEYELTPPAGGNHLGQWQTCTGIVYSEPITDGHAVHSLEHGAVWLTYDPEIASEDEVAELAKKIEGRNYSFMSPYPEQGVKISLQSWGNQYQTDDAGDGNIDRYLNYYIQNRDFAAEPGATCSGGTQAIAAQDSGMDMSEEEYQRLLEEMMAEEEGDFEDGAEDDAEGGSDNE